MSLRSAFERIWKGWFGDVYPVAGPVPLEEMDAREHALRALADFIADLEFANPDSMKVPTFQIERSNVFTAMPPDPSQLKFPAVAFMPARGKHDQYALGPADDVGDVGDAGPGQSTLLLGEYVETFAVECWANHDALRTSMLAGIASAIRTGSWSQALLLNLSPDYNAIARFTLVDSEHIDDPDVVRGRVRARLYLLLEVPEIKTVFGSVLQPRMRNEENPTPVDPDE